MLPYFYLYEVKIKVQLILIVIVIKIYPENQKNIQQSREEISNTLLHVELDNYVLDLKNKISQQILNGSSLDEIAIDNSLVVKSFKNAERQNNSVENDSIKIEIIEKAFEMNKDFVSDLMDIDDDKSIIVNVDKIENEKPYELNQVFELVSSDWIRSLKIKKNESI